MRCTLTVTPSDNARKARFRPHYVRQALEGSLPLLVWKKNFFDRSGPVNDSLVQDAMLDCTRSPSLETPDLSLRSLIEPLGPFSFYDIEGRGGLASIRGFVFASLGSSVSRGLGCETSR